jgi:hypothetical protein
MLYSSKKQCEMNRPIQKWKCEDPDEAFNLWFNVESKFEELAKQMGYNDSKATDA